MKTHYRANHSSNAILIDDIKEENTTSTGRIDLLPGEEVVSIRRVDAERRPHRPDAARALAALARVDAPSQVGLQGPLLAAIAEPGAQDPALHNFEAVFGRDSLISAMSVVSGFPRLLFETVRYLATYQGQQFDESKAEEPGKIPHEIRSPDDPVAKQLTTEHGWGWPYFGSIDATPLFLLACARCVTVNTTYLDTALKCQDGSVTPLRQSVRKAAEWLAGKLETSNAGFLESSVQAHGGLTNQTWKDSWDAFSSADGQIITPPIAAVEVQALAFDAARAAARLLRDETAELATRLEAAATRLRNAVLETLWLNDGGFFALGAHPTPSGAYKPLWVAASNMGHLLDSNLLGGNDYGEIRRRIIEKLFTPELLCPGGIRTLGTNEARYRPGSYHNGSCWPWDTAKIARGLRRFGYTSLADILTRRVLDVCVEFGGFPEFCRGDADAIRFNDRIVDVRDQSGRSNRIEQPPQQVQAWTVAAVIEFESVANPQPSSSKSVIDQKLETQIVDRIVDQ
ncbi:amylo-alpha-1,6-glucosidase [Trebonia sp.]|uniref:amylo-alpha-1,6-glucosidase n=1 Tax=Trebonia sp. TaxID=2767075 RepID=UPI0026109E6F|nr:amylo-alpha-1,6-glucosidase [Trebonia sp.]